MLARQYPLLCMVERLNRAAQPHHLGRPALSRLYLNLMDSWTRSMTACLNTSLSQTLRTTIQHSLFFCLMFSRAASATVAFARASQPASDMLKLSSTAYAHPIIANNPIKLIVRKYSSASYRLGSDRDVSFVRRYCKTQNIEPPIALVRMAVVRSRSCPFRR